MSRTREQETTVDRFRMKSSGLKADHFERVKQAIGGVLISPDSEEFYDVTILRTPMNFSVRFAEKDPAGGPRTGIGDGKGHTIVSFFDPHVELAHQGLIIEGNNDMGLGRVEITSDSITFRKASQGKQQP